MRKSNSRQINLRLFCLSALYGLKTDNIKIFLFQRYLIPLYNPIFAYNSSVYNSFVYFAYFWCVRLFKEAVEFLNHFLPLLYLDNFSSNIQTLIFQCRYCKVIVESICADVKVRFRNEKKTEFLFNHVTISFVFLWTHLCLIFKKRKNSNRTLIRTMTVTKIEYFIRFMMK